MKVDLNNGLTNSLIVLELLRSFENSEIEVSVQSFHNCREMGLTFAMNWYRNEDKKLKMVKNPITFCIYEHRNTDNIIINGKVNWTSFNGDLPYRDDNKHSNYASFKYNEHYKAAEWLFNFWKNQIEELEEEENQK